MSEKAKNKGINFTLRGKDFRKLLESTKFADEPFILMNKKLNNNLAKSFKVSDYNIFSDTLFGTVSKRCYT